MQNKEECEDIKFPKDFLWGAATSAHQVEGNNTNNQWWAWEREGGHISDGSVSGRACDHYNLYEKDFDLVKELGHNAHRFSIEWSRIEPKEGEWNKREIEHYRRVIQALKERDIIPMVTLHHFTDPLWLAETGGWLNPKAVDFFERYTRKVVETMGDLIPFYHTINEPVWVAYASYGLGVHPPCHTDMNEFYTAAKHFLMAHGKCYQAIHETIKHMGYKIKPQAGIVKQMMYYEPVDPNVKEDVEEARRMDELTNKWFLEGIHTGIIREPFGKGEELDYLKGSWDLIGVNYYTRSQISPRLDDPKVLELMMSRRGETTDMYEVYPEGFYKQLMSTKKYSKPVYVTENGIATKDDKQRCKYILTHLKEVHKAISNGLNLKGFLYWSLMDNFEWSLGYTMRFGLIEINYETLERKPRPSAHLYRNIIKSNKITTQQFKEYL